MTRSNMKFIRGMGIGMIAGCVMGIVGFTCLKRNKRCFKKRVSKALRNVSDLVENVNEMF